MKKQTILRSAVFVSAIMISSLVGFSTNYVFATPPTSPNGNQNGGNGGSANVTYSAKNEFKKSNSQSNVFYESTTGGENAILASAGTLNLTNPTVKKSGDSNGDNADFYGTNAAVLSIESSKIKISGGEITTNGAHANAVFAYGNSTIDISDAIIKTTSNNSGGVMVTGGGTLNATNLVVETDGNSSAPIRSDRGGGTMTISGGEYTSNGIGSPAIYSTANITVKGGDTTLKSNASEGVVIEGANSVSIEDGTSIIANNTKLNGNSETYKSIFIYQSMSGDASEGTGTFSVKDSSVDTLNGDTFFVTNTNAKIEIEHSKFTYGESTDLTNRAFLRIQAGKWGKSGENGGNVTLTSKNSPLRGNIVVDKISTLDATLAEKTEFLGAINTAKIAKEITISLDKISRIILTGDSYITTLKNEVEDNSNIYANGHKLYVNGTEAKINQNAPEEWTYDFSRAEESEATTATEAKEDDKTWLVIILVASGVVLIVAVTMVVITLEKKKKEKRFNEEAIAISQAENNRLKKPWEKA